MIETKLWNSVFDIRNWKHTINKAEFKNMNREVIEFLSTQKGIETLKEIVGSGSYTITPPRIAKIPKDEKGEFREVYINSDLDRILLSAINDALFELFGDMVHENCKSYQKGESTQKTVRTISKRLEKYEKLNNQIGFKYDFSKYFDNVNIESIEFIFDEVERKMGLNKDENCELINILRRYYRQDLYFDVDGNLNSRYQGLKQGCAVASFLADAILFDLDKYMSKHFDMYYRYSDDLICIDVKKIGVITDTINNKIDKYGISLNPKKIKPIYSNKWFTFLGFKISGNQITLSDRRVEKFQNIISEKTIKLRNCKGKRAARNVISVLFKGEHSWASACLSTINVDADINELNKYVLDCIKACETGKKKIGGLGTCDNLSNKTILRGRGRNVRANREKVIWIDNFISMKCASDTMKISLPVFEAIVRDIAR